MSNAGDEQGLDCCDHSPCSPSSKEVASEGLADSSGSGKKLKYYLHWALIAVPLALVWTYRLTLSKVLPPTCRFRPSCSHYALIALKNRGLVAGGILVAYRILRCNPFCKSGHDPVPMRGWPNSPVPFEPVAQESAEDSSEEKLAS